MNFGDVFILLSTTVLAMALLVFSMTLLFSRVDQRLSEKAQYAIYEKYGRDYKRMLAVILLVLAAAAFISMLLTQ